MRHPKILSLLLLCFATSCLVSCGSGSNSSTTTDTTSAAPAMQDTSKMMTDSSSKMMTDTTKMDTANPRPIKNPPKG